jgi:hypothetical protein
VPQSGAAKSLPAAATTTTPRSRAYAIASCTSEMTPVNVRAWTPGSAPSDRFTTDAPWSTE